MGIYNKPTEECRFGRTHSAQQEERLHEDLLRARAKATALQAQCDDQVDAKQKLL